MQWRAWAASGPSESLSRSLACPADPRTSNAARPPKGRDALFAAHISARARVRRAPSRRRLLLSAPRPAPAPPRRPAKMGLGADAEAGRRPGPRVKDPSRWTFLDRLSFSWMNT